jgi:hypothetical protein
MSVANDRSLPNLIKDITLFYIKHHYFKYLKDNNINAIDEIKLRELIDDLYETKHQILRDYIRENLKNNLKDAYTPTVKLTSESIILEMFSDPRLAKERVITEIMKYQENK